jgi:hypothetical protein
MSYRLITKATITLANNERQADVRAYAAPKGAPVGEITLNGEATPFKLTGGQGRGTVVRCYMYFMFKGESAYIEITKEEMTELKAKNHATLVTQDKIDTTASVDRMVSEALAEATITPKAKRVSKKAKATEQLEDSPY